MTQLYKYKLVDCKICNQSVEEKVSLKYMVMLHFKME